MKQWPASAKLKHDVREYGKSAKYNPAKLKAHKYGSTLPDVHINRQYALHLALHGMQ